MSVSIAMFYVPCENEEKARELGNAGVREKLAACYNCFDIQSGFFWDGAMQNDDEVVLILKTSRAASSDLHQFLVENHPYDTPCIAHWTIEVNGAYADWIIKNTR